MTAKSAPKSYTKQQEYRGKQLPNVNRNPLQFLENERIYFAKYRESPVVVQNVQRET